MSEPSRLPRLLAIAVVATLGVLALGATRAWRVLEITRAKESELVERIAREEESVRILAERVERLRREPETLATAAREELGWVRPDEVLVVFAREPLAPTLSAAPTPIATPRR